MISSDDGAGWAVGQTTGLPAGRCGGRGPHRPTGALFELVFEHDETIQ
jgi:hypothetical protein